MTHEFKSRERSALERALEYLERVRDAENFEDSISSEWAAAIIDEIKRLSDEIKRLSDKGESPDDQAIWDDR